MKVLRVGVLAFVIMSTVHCSSSEVSRSLGARCETRDECDERCVRGDDYPEGLCTTSCESDGDCPITAHCIDEEGGICLYFCALDVDCEFLGVGWSCREKDSRENDQEVLVCLGD